MNGIREGASTGCYCRCWSAKRGATCSCESGAFLKDPNTLKLCMLPLCLKHPVRLFMDGACIRRTTLRGERHGWKLQTLRRQVAEKARYPFNSASSSLVNIRFSIEGRQTAVDFVERRAMEGNEMMRMRLQRTLASPSFGAFLGVEMLPAVRVVHQHPRLQPKIPLT